MSIATRSPPQPKASNRFFWAIAKLAERHASYQREAFRRAAASRPDSLAWRPLEEACSQMLERRREKALRHLPVHAALRRLANTDDRVEGAMELFLGRAGAESYLRAVSSLQQDTAHWAAFSGTAALAFWRHASLVWLALRYAALAPNAGAAEAAACVGFTLKRKSAPKTPLAAALRWAARAFAVIGCEIGTLFF